jgi:predicted nucleic acid-binding protein
VAGALPGPVYCDASALVKVYVPEPESPAVNRALADRDDVFVSDLAITEVVSALARRRNEGRLDRAAAARAYGRLLADRAAGVFECLETTASVHRRAEQGLLASGRGLLRAADALHLALALEHQARSMAVYDARLAQAAFAAGLVVFPDDATA